MTKLPTISSGPSPIKGHVWAPNSKKKRFQMGLIGSDDENKCDKLTDIGRRYLQETSLHGLKYIVEKARHPSERCFWMVAVSISWIAAFGLISQVYL
jgi:hypothetical protein